MPEHSKACQNKGCPYYLFGKECEAAEGCAGYEGISYEKGTEKSLRLLRDGRMVHKEKYCAYWHCERNGGTTCWDWGNKWAGMICPNDERCEKYRVCANCNGVMGKCQTYQKVKRGEL